MAKQALTQEFTQDSSGEYDPRLDKNGFMNAQMLAFFRAQLNRKREEILAEATSFKGDIISLAAEFRAPDPVDRAAALAGIHTGNKRASKAMNLIDLVNAALKRMDEGEFGYCVDTGEEIDVARLFHVPWAQRTIDAQQGHDRRTKLGLTK